MLTPSMGEPRV
ncbi:hypothetical protein E2C01_061614 [Portunus trituberculatus]|uniref:Uncharacterized protein n=1 Tax=Portunus trituberculatus TaxID=210409 RepID=A0A5B7HC53_PORTR|nr:hypothetical protein [Portunus trituberculatus]